MSNEKWKETEIKTVLNDAYAGATPSRARSDYFNGNIPWISSGEINEGVITKTKEQISQLGYDSSSVKWIPEKSVLIAMYGATAGQVAKLKIKATSNQAVLALLPNAGLMDSDYLYHLLKIKKNKILYFAQGSGQPNLSKDIVEKFKILYPKDTAEQLTRAEILNTTDDLITQTELVIAKFKSIKQGMLHDLFTRGIDVSTGKLRPAPQQAPHLYKETVLGWIPREWEVKRLGSYCDIPCSYGINAAAVDFNPNLPLYFRITDITDNGQYSKTNRKSVDNRYSDNYILKKGDVVFARTGATVGKTYIYNESDGKLIYAGFLIKFSPNPQKLNPYYLKFYTDSSMYWKWVNVYSQRSGQPGINGNEYSSMLMSTPILIEEQNKIAENLLSVEDKINSEQQILSKYQSIKKGLMKRLLEPENENI